VVMATPEKRYLHSYNPILSSYLIEDIAKQFAYFFSNRLNNIFCKHTFDTSIAKKRYQFLAFTVPFSPIWIYQPKINPAKAKRTSPV
jgi:FPC/CPF motif-containing protein YcgG